MIWNLIAKILARPAVRVRLIRRAWKTPYTHIQKGGDTYTMRFWLFNPYDLRKDEEKTRWQRFMSKLPSVRLHKILLADQDRHSHSHPWDCRTIILDGCYFEERLVLRAGDVEVTREYLRSTGTTATLNINDYHRITDISPGGVWTLFITWKYQGVWGFWVDGKKVPYREYLGI